MLDTTFTSIDMFQTHTTCQIVIPSLLPILTQHLPSSAQQMSVHRSTVCEVAKPSGLHGPNCMACHNERMIKRIGRKKTIWNVRQNATWHRKQNPRYIPDKMSDKLLEYVWNGCDEFSCFLVALFAWYVGPLVCKGVVSLICQLNNMSAAMPNH